MKWYAASGAGLLVQGPVKSGLRICRVLYMAVKKAEAPQAMFVV